MENGRAACGVPIGVSFILAVVISWGAVIAFGWVVADAVIISFGGAGL